jgi:glycosyltransferase involved in cell wall biosynthesis
MIRTVHVIDKDTPRDMLAQLALLVGLDEEVICIGPLPACVPAGLGPRQVRAPFRLAALGGLQVKLDEPKPQAVHVWSMSAHAAAEQIAYDLYCPLIVSLPCLPLPADMPVLLAVLPRRERMFTTVATVPAEPARAALIAAGVHPDAVAVLPAPAAVVADRADRRVRTRAALGIPDDEILLVSPEDMVRGAGQKWAIWCHAIVRQILPAAKLILPGHGPHEDSIRFFADTTGFGSEILFTGEEIALEDALAAADLALFLCDRDTSPQALSAAMTAASAIVATRTPCATHLLREGVSALFTPSGDPRLGAAAMLKFCDSPDLRRRLGAAAASNSDTTPEHIRQTLERIYADALARGR